MQGSGRTVPCRIARRPPVQGCEGVDLTIRLASGVVEYRQSPLDHANPAGRFLKRVRIRIPVLEGLVNRRSTATLGGSFGTAKPGAGGQQQHRDRGHRDNVP